MARITTCPACRRDISIPGAAHPQDRMRCPLCSAEFAVHQVLADSIEAPPDAIPVEQPHVNVPAAVGPSLSRVDDLSSHAIRSAPRAKPRQPSIFGQFVGIVGGGALGLAIGYLALLRFGGLHYDFLQVAGHLPPWMLPADKKADDELIAPHRDEDDRPRRELSDLLVEPAPPFEPPSADPVPAESTPTEAPEAAPAPNDESRPEAPPAKAPEQPMVGPRAAPRFTDDELGIALSDAAAAIVCQTCAGSGQVTRELVSGTRDEGGKKVAQVSSRKLACAACDGHGVVKFTPEVYAQLCRLAEVVPFVVSDAGDNELLRRREGVQNLVLRAAGDKSRAEALGRLSGYQLDSTARTRLGIALAGTVQEIKKEGSLFATKLVLFGQPKVVTVLSARSPEPILTLRDRAIILGTLVERPAENIIGYQGDLPLVVWGGMRVKLPVE